MAEEKNINETESAADEVNADADNTCECAENEKKPKECKKEEKKIKNELAETKKKLEECEKKLAEMNDKYLRIMAEYDNYRKRTAKEKEGSFTDGCFDALAGVLPIMDNVERAVAFKGSDKVSEGIDLILKSFGDMLGKFSVTPFGEVGEEFDPNIHNAVMHIEDENLGENTIVEVFQKGYRKGDRILRHAMVKVAN